MRAVPRFLVSIIVLLSALAGFLTSFVLLHSGLRLMWVRYPISIVVAYFVFLVLLALWLWLQRRSLEPDFDVLSVLEHAQVDANLSHFSAGGSGSFGGGGDFGGGGAGGSWASDASMSSTVTTSDTSVIPSIDAGLDLEEGLFIVLAIVAILGGLMASLYIIYIAPVLLAEILLDGVLVAGLYKRVKHIEQRHWLRAAIRRTIVPALLVVLFFGIAGYALQKAVPKAHTMGEVWREVMR